MLTDADLPAMFRATDRASIDGQHSAIRRMFFSLMLIVLAAAGSAFNWDPFDRDINVGGLLSTGAFIGALVLGLSTVRKRPEEEWYEGRAGAESIKTLAWMYSVGGEPYPIGRVDVDEAFVNRLRQILDRLRHIEWPPLSGDQITSAMRNLRSSDLAARRAAYLTHRIQDQIDWYTSKSDSNDTKARRWALAGGVIVMAGVIAGLMRTFEILDVDILGIFAAMSASVAAWIELKQYRTLATAYSLAAQELALVLQAAAAVTEEQAWSTFAAEAEEAISREHTMWLARRGKVNVSGYGPA